MTVSRTVRAWALPGPAVCGGHCRNSRSRVRPKGANQRGALSGLFDAGARNDSGGRQARGVRCLPERRARRWPADDRGVQDFNQYFEKAVAQQPDYAVAHAAIAQSQLQFLYTGPLAPIDVIPKAEAEVRAALKLDDTIGHAHVTLGTILQQFYWQWNEGEKEFRRAQALDGSGTNSIILSMIRSGRTDESIAEGERSISQDPQSFDAHASLGTALRSAGQYEHALSEFNRALEIIPGRPRGHFQLGITLLFMGRLPEAISELETSLESRRNPRLEAYLGYAYAVARRRDDARAILNNLVSSSRQAYISSFGIALIHDALNEKAEALAALERACEDHAVEFAQMPQYPPFKNIANEKRYHAVMRRVGLDQ